MDRFVPGFSGLLDVFNDVEVIGQFLPLTEMLDDELLEGGRIWMPPKSFSMNKSTLGTRKKIIFLVGGTVILIAFVGATAYFWMRSSRPKKTNLDLKPIKPIKQQRDEELPTEQDRSTTAGSILSDTTSDTSPDTRTLGTNRRGSGLPPTFSPMTPSPQVELDDEKEGPRLPSVSIDELSDLWTEMQKENGDYEVDGTTFRSDVEGTVTITDKHGRSIMMNVEVLGSALAEKLTEDAKQEVESRTDGNLTNLGGDVHILTKEDGSKELVKIKEEKEDRETEEKQRQARKDHTAEKNAAQKKAAQKKAVQKKAVQEKSAKEKSAKERAAEAKTAEETARQRKVDDQTAARSSLLAAEKKADQKAAGEKSAKEKEQADAEAKTAEETARQRKVDDQLAARSSLLTFLKALRGLQWTQLFEGSEGSEGKFCGMTHVPSGLEYTSTHGGTTTTVVLPWEEVNKEIRDELLKQLPRDDFDHGDLVGGGQVRTTYGANWKTVVRKALTSLEPVNFSNVPAGPFWIRPLEIPPNVNNTYRWKVFRLVNDNYLLWLAYDGWFSSMTVEKFLTELELNG